MMRRITQHLAAALVCALVCPAWAGDGQGVVLQGGTVLTGTGQTIENGVVVMGLDGKIISVGNVAPEGEGYKVVDCTGKVVTAGFVDVATQLGVVEVSLEAGTRDGDPGGDNVRAAFRVADGFNPNSAVIPIQRTGGVTSAGVLPSGGFVRGQSAWIDLAGDAAFATLVRSPTAMHIGLGHGGAAATGGSRGGAILALRELYDDARFYAKNRGKYNENRSRRLAASRLDLDALAKTFDGGLPVVFHVDRASDIRTVLLLSKELGVRPVIQGGAEGWMVASELAATNTPVVLDAMLNLPRSFEALGAREDNAALLAKAGVPVILSVFDTHNARNVRQMAGNAIRGGMTPEAALAAVTVNPAAAMGMADYGTLAPGKVANVVVWSGDPFELSTHVEHMFIRSVEVSLYNRQQALFERYRTIPRRGDPAEYDEIDMDMPE
jgi:imidazolonepropionase-like amidohydrolase